MSPTERDSFWDTLQEVIDLGSKNGGAGLQIGASLLGGPIGGTIAAVAGTAISAISAMSKHADQALEASVESDYEQHASRAILAEASLEAVLKMDREQAQNDELFTRMQHHFSQTQNQVPMIAKMIAPAITDPALMIAVDSKVHSTETSPVYPQLSATESSSIPASASFAEDLLRQAKPDPSQATSTAEQNNFFSFLSDVVQTGVSVTAPVNVVPIIADVDEDEDGPKHDASDKSPHVEALARRALLAEAALQALMDSPIKKTEQEGVFGDIINTVKTIGETVVKVAPTVIKTVIPAIDSQWTAASWSDIIRNAKFAEVSVYVGKREEKEEEYDADSMHYLPRDGLSFVPPYARE